MTSDSSVSALVDSIIAEDGKIDILVNNAGIALAASLENAFIDEAKVRIQLYSGYDFNDLLFLESV